MHNAAAQAYGKVATETAGPRDLEASLLLRAAARLQSVRDNWDGASEGLDDALVYNRKLWSVFLTSVTRDDHPLPRDVRQNIANLGLFVMNHTVSLGADRNPARLGSLISINREIAAGLMGKA